MLKKFSRYGILNTFRTRLQEPVVLFRQGNAVCSNNHAKQNYTTRTKWQVLNLVVHEVTTRI